MNLSEIFAIQAALLAVAAVAVVLAIREGDRAADRQAMYALMSVLAALAMAGVPVIREGGREAGESEGTC